MADTEPLDLHSETWGLANKNKYYTCWAVCYDQLIKGFTETMQYSFIFPHTQQTHQYFGNLYERNNPAFLKIHSFSF